MKSRLRYKWEIQGYVSTNKMCWTRIKLLLKKLFIINNDYLQYHCKIIRRLRDRRAPGSSGWDLENTVSHISKYQQSTYFLWGLLEQEEMFKPRRWATLWPNLGQREENLPFTRSPLIKEKNFNSLDKNISLSGLYCRSLLSLQKG